MENDEKALVEQINGQKVVVVRTLNGNVVINADAILREEARKKTTWRPLSHFVYPSQRLERDLKTNLVVHLGYNLYDMFSSQKYTHFTSTIDIAEETHADQQFSMVHLCTQHARFANMIETLLKKLWNPGGDRLSLQKDLNERVVALQQRWSFRVNLLAVAALQPYEFICDPDGEALSVQPSSELSTDPADYPQGVKTTSEMFKFVAAHLRAQFAFTNLDVTFESLAVSKLVMLFLDRRGFRWDDFRINAEDVEEWDYVDPEAERIVRGAVRRS